MFNALTYPAELKSVQHVTFIVYGMDYLGSKSNLIPMLSRLSVSGLQKDAFASGVPPRIKKFSFPLEILPTRAHSSEMVEKAVKRFTTLKI